jgi:hypothetical protein
VSATEQLALDVWGLKAGTEEPMGSSPDVTVRHSATQDTPDSYPVITIREPWLACILAGADQLPLGVLPKDVENRVTRHHRAGIPQPPCTHRGLVLLHGSQRVDRAALQDPRVVALWRPLGRLLEVITPGRIAGYATITDCHYSQSCCCGIWGDPGCWHITLADVGWLPRPVVARGCLALPWRLQDPDLVGRVRDQLPTAVVAS